MIVIINLIVTSALLGVGLAMDAFSVSLANGLSHRNIKTGEMSGVAATFALFQFAMPMIGWLIVHTAAAYMPKFEAAVPLIALILLCLLGIKMIMEGLSERRETEQAVGQEREKPGIATLLLQGVATSIDALSVGFATSAYGAVQALISSLIIGIVTYFICMLGLLIGRKAGTYLSWKASMLGGFILIIIGIRIFAG